MLIVVQVYISRITSLLIRTGAGVGGRGETVIQSKLGAGEPYSFVTNVKLCVVDANEDVTQDPEGVGHIQSLETADAHFLDTNPLLQGTRTITIIRKSP